MTTPLQRRQIAWLRSNVVSRCADGQPLDAADLAALPKRLRAEIQAVADDCATLHQLGERGQAQTLARVELGLLDLGDWEPPTGADGDPRELAALVPRH